MFENKKMYKQMIKASFGKNPLELNFYYNATDRMKNVRRFHELEVSKEYQIHNSKNYYIDDITWNDLEMDEVFLRINHTNSFIGEQMLYHKLHNLSDYSSDEYCQVFEDRVSRLELNPDLRIDIECKLKSIGKQDGAYFLPEFLHNSGVLKLGSSLVYHLLQLLLIFFAVTSLVFDNTIFVAGLVLVVITNLCIYLVAKQKYEVYLSSLSVFKQIYDFASWMDSKDLFVTEELKGALHSLDRMSKVIFKFGTRKQAAVAGDISALLNDYLWGITLLDVSMFNHIMHIIENKQDDIMTLLEFAGEIDSDISVLSYRNSIDLWCEPEFIITEHEKTEPGKVEENCGSIAIKRISHPLLNNPVRNDFVLQGKAIITGANASGKSTFMKSVAINCLLAQTIHTCIADSVVMSRMHIMTCMSLRDDLISGESYYIREAKYLKRMLDVIDEGIPVLCVIDEILKGTNTKERIAASKAILDYIGNRECMALVATHDNELTETAYYDNYHFTSVITDGDMFFDYKLYRGKSTDSNAIALLFVLGYPNSIVDAAREDMK